MKKLSELRLAVREVGGRISLKGNSALCYRPACQGTYVRVANMLVSDEDYERAIEIVSRTSRPASLIN